MKKRYILLGILLLFVAGLMFGPRPEFAKIKAERVDVSASLGGIEDFVKQRESLVSNIKPDNESRFYWVDSARKTEYAIVYLHGFSASPMEGNPTHREIAERYGCNLYVPRLFSHGLEEPDALEGLTPQKYIESAEEALSIGQMIGDKVILMSCSTGGTLSIYLAAKHPELVAAQILFSPNIAIAAPTASMATGPWGRELVTAMVGERRDIPTLTDDDPGSQYWTRSYSTEALIALQALIDQSMTEEVWAGVKQPYLVACYYKDEENQDPVVSVAAMREFYAGTSTPDDQKRFAEISDVNDHVFISDLRNDDLTSVRETSNAFMEEVLGLSVYPSASED
ncbi:MAG: alpha/beta fold hydrolase [Bacteroidota bacterium]